MRMKNLETYRTGGTSANMQLGIPVPLTPDGRAYRYSPNEQAFPRHFVLGNRMPGFPVPETMSSRMTHMPGQPGTVCPYSGILDDDDAFIHPDDKAAAIDTVRHAAMEDVTAAFHDMFSDLGRKFGSSKHVKIQAGSRKPARPKPRFARKDLLREIVCDECGRDYGVFAISLFCPDCGAPNLHLHFAREVDLVRQQVELAERLEHDQGELAYRLLGNAHEDVLTAFEASLKTAYLHRVSVRPANSPPIKSVGNAFQNIEKAQKRLAEFGFDPFTALDTSILAVLTLNIQKRHVIGHNLGVADANFAQHAADAKLGETVTLVARDILQFGAVCQMVVDSVDGWLANGHVPPPAGSLPIIDPLPEVSHPPALQIAGLGPLAVDVGLWISGQSETGYDTIIEGDDIRAAFQDQSVADLELAVAELSADGYVTSTHYSSDVPRVRTTADLFATFDPHTQQHDPVADAAKLAEIILAGPDAVDVGALHAETGWPLRRFNPAIAQIIPLIDSGRVGDVYGTEYPSRWFHALAEDRVELKRFVTRSGR